MGDGKKEQYADILILSNKSAHPEEVYGGVVILCGCRLAILALLDAPKALCNKMT